ncbi:MAG TPA: hypothetical protein VNG93_03195 [Candidatus Dormibacteraeota bacterium]|nr:hypothetical protein [Candidatus Dormibacteraeota bacterium]
MNESGRATRRGILKLGAIALAGVAGAAGIGAAAEYSRSAAGVEGAVGTPPRLHGSSWHLQAAGLKRGVLPKPGDRVTITGVLSATPDGPPLGSFFATSMHLDMPGATGPARAEMQMHTIQLPEGSLVGMGTAVGGADATYAVIGGTGRYAGASGSYTAVQRPFEVGGNGTAELTLDLKMNGEGR